MFRDGKGNERVIRVGASSLPVMLGGDKMDIENDIPLSKSKDASENKKDLEERTSRKIDEFPDDKLEEIWDKMKSHTKIFDESGVEYFNSADKAQNCNTFSSTLLKLQGVDPQKYLDENIKNFVPGMESNLLDSTQYKNLEKAYDKNNPYYDIMFDEEQKKKAEEKILRQEKARKLVEQLRKNNNKAHDVLYKKSENISEEEIKEANRFAAYETKDPDLKSKIDKRIGDWYNDVYGSGDVKQDATGRPMEPVKKIRVTTEFQPLKTADGLDFEESIERLGRQISNYDDAEKRLQRGINRGGYLPPLKEDGNWGTKTMMAVKDSLINKGWNTLAKLLDDEDDAAEEQKKIV